ncbi:MAG TPA: hypothetical protein VGD58_30380 [Herpetosiphonaceae bacterium]
MIRQGWFRAGDAAQTAVAERTAARAECDRGPLVGRCFEWSTLTIAALIVAAVLVDALRLTLTPLAVGGAAVVLLAPLVYLATRSRERSAWWRGDLWGDLVLLGVAAVLAWQTLAPAWPALLPIGDSPDSVHHTALANYILEQQHLVRDPETVGKLLIEMADYPPGFAALTAIVAQVAGVSPVRVIYPLAALAVIAGVVGCALLIMSTVPHSVRPLAGLAALLVLPMADYVVGAVADQNYYPQMLAQWLLVAIGYVATQHRDGQRLPRLALLLAALLVVYTTWLPVALLALTLTLLIRRVSWSRRLAPMAALLLPIGLLALIYSWSRAGTGNSVILHEGSTIRDPLATTGVTIPLLGLLGLLAAWRDSRRLPGLWLILAAAAQIAGLWLLWQRGQIAGYIYYKSYYLLALLLVVPIGWLLADALAVLLKRWRGALRPWAVLQPLAVIAALAGALLLPLLPSTTKAEAHPISPALLNAAAWIRDNGTPNSVSYALHQPGLPAYWVHVGVLEQPRTEAAHALLTRPSSNYFEWYFHPASTRFLLLEQPAPPEPSAGLAVRFQNECCVVLEKNESYLAAMQELRPLSVSFSATFKNGRQQVDLEVFDALDQPDLRARLVLEGAGQQLAAYTIDVPQRSGRMQYLGFAFDPQTLAATGYMNTEPGLEWPAASAPVPPDYRVRLQLLKGDDVVRETEIATCCVAPGVWQPAVVQPHGAWTYFRPPQSAAAPTRDQTLGQEIRLIDAEIVQAQLRPGQTLDLRLRWQARETITRRYTTFVQLIAADGGAAFSLEGEPNGGGSPTWRWQSGDQIADAWQLKLPENLQPATYQVVVGMYDPATGKRLEAWQQSPSVERFWVDALPLGSVEVRP